jgi:hypothetical protein
MNAPQKPTAVRRSDWRSATAWVLQSRGHAAFMITLLVVAGVCSVLGLLRWQQSVAQWSFAAICWVLATMVAARAPWRIKKTAAGKTTRDSAD